jgi:hypothetical protein
LPQSGGFYDVGDQPALVFDQQIIVAEMDPVGSFRRFGEMKSLPIGDIIERAIASRDVLTTFVDVGRRVVALSDARLVGVRTGEISARVKIRLDRRGAVRLWELGQGWRR